MVLKKTQQFFIKIKDGVHLMAAAMISIGVHSFFANVSYMTNLHITRSIIILSDIFIIINWIIAIIGINKKNYTILKLALVFWSIFLCFWIGSIIMSITANGEKYICSFGRCPESMWLFNNSWHKDSLITISSDYELDYDYVIKSLKVYYSSSIHDYDGYGKSRSQDDNPIPAIPNKIVQEHTHFLNKNLSYEMIPKIVEPRQMPNITRPPRSAAVIDPDDLKLYSDRVRTLPVQNITKMTSVKEDVLTGILIGIMFGFLAFGWFLLFSHVFKLKYQIESKYNNETKL